MTDSLDTTTLSAARISFSSAGAVRSTVPGGIHRETILRQRHTAVIPAVQLAHQTLMAALATETPHNIVGYAADRFDIEERGAHLKTVLTAVHTYAKAIVEDTAHMGPCGYIKTGNVGLLNDAASDINAVLMDCVDRMIDDQAEAAA
jgi:hypothetical protein